MVESHAKTKFSLRTMLVCLALVLVTSAIYWQLRHAPFIVYDDPEYVQENPHVNSGLSWAGVKWAFSGGHEANWHPLTWISHMLDCQWFGLDAGKHHLVNLAFHVINSVLLFGLLRYLTGAFWRSALVAALFAWHPAHVGSVAWIAERKDMLSTFFWLLAIFAYAGYCKRPGISAIKNEKQPPESGTGKSRLFYLLTLLLSALGLMSKPMVVTFPFLLLVLDYWPLQRRASWPRLLIEKLPLIALSVVSCIITYEAQAAYGATGNFTIPFGTRLANAVIGYARYVGKLFWPSDLAVIYPYNMAPPVEQVIGAFFLLLLISAAAVFLVRRKPYLFAGWCWFLGTLVPVIGVVQVGKQSIADRYTYVPFIGLFIAIVWLAGDLTAVRPALKPLAIGAAVLALLGCVLGAARETGYWQSSELLFRRTLEVTTNNFVGEYNLAHILYEKGRPEEAAVHYENSLRLEPNQSISECNLGLCLAKMGRHRDATTHFEKALDLDANDPSSQHDNQWATHLDYGLSLEALGDTNAAVAQYHAAIRRNPDAYKAHYALGSLFLAGRRFAEAKPEFEETLRMVPKEVVAHCKLAETLGSLGQTGAAIAEYKAALRISPDAIAPLNDLAWILAASADPSFRDGAEAVQLARHACELSNYQEPLLIGTLADAYAEAGQFKEAEDAAIKARDLAAARNLKNIAGRNEELLQLYRAHQAYHEKAAMD